MVNSLNALHGIYMFLQNSDAYNFGNFIQNCSLILVKFSYHETSFQLNDSKYGKK